MKHVRPLAAQANILDSQAIVEVEFPKREYHLWAQPAEDAGDALLVYSTGCLVLAKGEYAGALHP